MDIAALTSSFSSVPTDWIVIAVLIVLGTFDAVRTGTGRITALALAFVLATIAVDAAKKAFLISTFQQSFQTPVLQAVFFGIAAVLLFFLMRRIITDFSLDGAHPLTAVIASVAAVSLMLAVWIHAPALSSVWQFSSTLQHVFSDQYIFWWMLGGLATLAFTHE